MTTTSPTGLEDIDQKTLDSALATCNLPEKTLRALAKDAATWEGETRSADTILKEINANCDKVRQEELRRAR